MKLVKKDFQNAVKAAMMATAQDSTVYASGDCLLFDKGTIYSYNGYISIAKKFATEEPLEGAVRAKELNSILGKLPDKEIEITNNEKSWKIKSGKSVYELIKKAELEQDSIKRIIPEEDAWIPVPSLLFEALDFCTLTSSTMSTNIYISGTTVYATDGFRIYRYTLDTPVKENILFDTQLAKSVVSFGTAKEYAVTKGWLHFRDSEGSIISIRRANVSQYPVDDIEKAVKDNIDDTYQKCAIPETLLDVVNRASILSKEIDDYSSILMKLNRDGIIVKSSNEYGNFEELIETEMPYDATFIVSVAMLKDCLKNTSSFYVKKTAVKGTYREALNLVFYSDNGIKILSTMD